MPLTPFPADINGHGWSLTGSSSELEIAKPTRRSWLAQYDDMKASVSKPLKELEAEKLRLKARRAPGARHRHALRVAEGNF